MDESLDMGGHAVVNVHGDIHVRDKIWIGKGGETQKRLSREEQVLRYVEREIQEAERESKVHEGMMNLEESGWDTRSQWNKGIQNVEMTLRSTEKEGNDVIGSAALGGGALVLAGLMVLLQRKRRLAREGES